MGREEKYEIPQTPEELEKAKEEEKKKKMLLVAKEEYDFIRYFIPPGETRFLESRVEFTYDEEGNLQGRIERDKEGNIIERVETTRITKREDGGKEKEIIRIDKDGKVIVKVKEIYDKNGRLIEETLRDLEPHPETTYVGYTSKFEYNDEGKLSKEIKIRERKDGKTKKEEKEYKYDTKGNLIELVEKDDGIEKREVYRYDEKTGKLIETLLFYKNKLEENYVYEYDEKGNLIAKKYKSKSGEVTPVEEYKYEYDSEGNLIKEIKTRKKIIREIYRTF
jgi:hypothetical protein